MLGIENVSKQLMQLVQFSFPVISSFETVILIFDATIYKDDGGGIG
jgi:hypothetical protein